MSIPCSHPTRPCAPKGGRVPAHPQDQAVAAVHGHIGRGRDEENFALDRAAHGAAHRRVTHRADSGWSFSQPPEPNLGQVDGRGLSSVKTAPCGRTGC